jgi:hypothetical protein
MELSPPEFTYEQQYVLELATLSYLYGRCSSFLREEIESKADKLADFLPDDKEEFVSSPQYKKYQMWIKSYYLAHVHDNHQKEILELTDPKKIRALSNEDKRCRKNFSDKVSDNLRRIKNIIYPQPTNTSECGLCYLKIQRLDLKCISCKTHFHLECLQKEYFICAHCGLHFVENSLVVFT